jgi:hypothetical protein
MLAGIIVAAMSLPRIVFAAALAFAALPAAAMHFIAEPPYLHLMGRVAASDWPVWEEAMERYKGEIDTIVFHRSPGGHSNTGRKIGQSIRKLGLKTIVAGRCVSACANMFLGGTERQFTERLGEVSPSPTLGFHGSYNRETKQVNRKRSGDYFLQMTDGKMSEELVERFIRIENYKGALFLVHPEQRKRRNLPLAYLCSGEEDTRNFDGACATADGVDALSTGVVTSWKLAPTPAAPKAPPKAETSKNW